MKAIGVGPQQLIEVEAERLEIGTENGFRVCLNRVSTSSAS